MGASSQEPGVRMALVKQCANAFLRCSDPEVLQQLSDSLLPYDVIACGQKWLAYLTPFFTETEHRKAGSPHRILFAQVEYCAPLISRRRAALDALSDRLLD